MISDIRRSRRKEFALIVLTALASVLAASLMQFVKGALLDSAVGGQARRVLVNGTCFLALILCESLFYWLFTRLVSGFVTGAQTDMRSELFSSVMRRDVPSFGEHRQGKIVAAFSNGVSQIADRYFDILPELVYAGARVVLIGASFFFLNWRSALIAGILLTMPLCIPKLIEKRLTRTQKECTDAYEMMLARVVDWFSGFETVKNFSLERQVKKAFTGANDGYSDALMRRASADNLAGLITMLMSYVSYFVIFTYSAWLVVKGESTVGEFTIAYGMMDQLSYPIISVARYLRYLVASRPTIESFDEFASFSGKGQNSYSGPFESGIEIAGVSFAYPDGTMPLENFSASFRKGGKYLITGASGSGKTTLSNLILRYHDPQEGDIRIDGQSVLNCTDIYRLAAVVRQDTVLFADTLRNNLGLYSDAVTDEAIIDMLRKVNLTGYASTEALSSNVADRGSNFSGGELRRISIARALLTGKRLLILDEPLANLDSENALAIASLITSIDEVTTVLVISHTFPPELMSRMTGTITVGAAGTV